MKVRYTRTALQQLDEILDYISQDNPDAAHKIIRHITNAIGSLSTFPLMGRKTDIENVRVLIITQYPYLVFYKTGETAVVIIRIRHDSQKPEE